MSYKARLISSINRSTKTPACRKTNCPHYSTRLPELTHDIQDIIRKQFLIAMKIEVESPPLYIPRTGISFKIVYFQSSLLLDLGQKRNRTSRSTKSSLFSVSENSRSK